MSVLRTLVGTVATKGLSMILTFVIGIVVSRSLGAAGKGAADTLVNVLMMLLLVVPAVEEPQLYLLGKKDRPPPVFLGNALFAALLFGVVVLLAFEALRAFAPDLFTFRDRTTGLEHPLDLGWLHVLVLVASLEFLHRIVGGLLQGLKDMRAFNLAHLAQHGSLLVLVLVLVVGFRQGVGGVVIAQAASIGIGGLTAIGFALRHPEIRGRRLGFDGALFRSLVLRGFRIHGGVIAAWVILMSDQLVLRRTHGDAPVGIYALAVALSGHLRRVILQPVKEVLGSRLPSMVSDPERVVETIATTTRHVLVLSVLPSLALGAVGWPLLRFVYGPSFADAYLPLLILLPGNWLWAAAVVSGYWLIGRDRLLTLTAIGLLVAATNLGLNLVLIPRFGMLAAASTSTLCYGLHLTLFLFVITRATGRRASAFLCPRRSDFAVYRSALASLRAKLGRRSGTMSDAGS